MRVKVCKAEDIEEGKARKVSIMARNIAVFKLDGKLYGLEADCKHMKACVADGKIEGRVVTCPMHGWRYDIPTGECLEESWARLKTFPAFEENGSIWVDVVL
jgi:nitrite reductase/ring-hydroxylating ferredoxin subunit